MVIKKIIKAAAKKGLKSKSKARKVRSHKSGQNLKGHQAILRKAKDSGIKLNKSEKRILKLKKSKATVHKKVQVKRKTKSVTLKQLANQEAKIRKIQTKRKSFIRQGPSWWTKSMEDNYSGQTRKQAQKNIATAKTKKERIHAIAAMWGYSSLRESEKREIGYSGFGGRHGYNYKENVETLRAGKKLPKRPSKPLGSGGSWVMQPLPPGVQRAKTIPPTTRLKKSRTVWAGADDEPGGLYDKYGPRGSHPDEMWGGDPPSSWLRQSGKKPSRVGEMSLRARLGFDPMIADRTDMALWGMFGGGIAGLAPVLGIEADLRNKKESKKKMIPKGQRDLKAEQEAVGNP